MQPKLKTTTFDIVRVFLSLVLAIVCVLLSSVAIFMAIDSISLSTAPHSSDSAIGLGVIILFIGSFAMAFGVVLASLGGFFLIPTKAAFEGSFDKLSRILRRVNAFFLWLSVGFLLIIVNSLVWYVPLTAMIITARWTKKTIASSPTKNSSRTILIGVVSCLVVIAAWVTLSLLLRG